MANLFSVSNGKVTFKNQFTEKEINEINLNSKKNNIKQLKKNAQEANKIVQQDTQKIGNYLNKNGQNVNINAPFSANLINNRQIMNTKNNLNSRITLQDVVKEHKDLMNSEKGQELKNKLRLSKNERAWADYNYNQAKVNSENTTFGDKTIGTVTRGIKDLFSNMTDARDVVDENGNTTRLPSYNELKQQKVSGDYKTGVGKFLGDASYNISKIGASTLMNIPTLGVGGSAIYWGDMYFDSYNNAKNEGYSSDKAFKYALTNTSFEYITGKFLGSATKGLTGGQTSELSNAISNGINRLISNPRAAYIIGNAGSEATEEFIQEYLDNLNKLVTLEGSKDPKDYINVLTDKNILKDALYSAGVGAISGGVMSGINSTEASNVINNSNLLETFKNSLTETRDSLTDKSEIVKYNKLINEIDEYITAPFGNEKKIYDVLPTVEELSKNNLNKKNIEKKNNTQKVQEDFNNNTTVEQSNQSKEQIQNRIASLKEEFQTYETFTNEATRTESETREINNIKQEIKNLQQELKQQNNIPTVQDLVNQERNQNNNPTMQELQQDGFKYSDSTNLSFDNQLDLWSNNQWNKDTNMVMLKNTPKIYLDAGLKENAITVTPSKMKEIVYGNKNHIGIGLENAKKLPQQIANPLNIIESTTKKNSIVIATELSDANNNMIIAAMAINGYGRLELLDIYDKKTIKKITSNAVSSAYGKDNYDSWISRNKDKIIYDKDDGIIKKRINGEWVQSPNDINSFADTSAGNIANSNITPTLEASAYDNNIPQINEKVKLLPTNNDMQNFENNAKKITNKEKNFQSLEATAPIAEQEQIAPVKKITTDPTKESSYDDADLPNFWELNKNKKSNLDNEIDEFKRAVDRQLQEEAPTPKQIKRNNTLKSQFETMWSDFQEKFVNRNYEIDKYSKKTGNKEIMFKGDMLNNVAGEVTGDINIGQTDNYGKQIGESLNSLFKNAKKKGYYDQFDDYLKHYSNIDRHGYGKGSVVPLEYSQKMVKAYEKSIPGIKNEATKVWQYGKNMLSNMEENGLISKDFKAKLEDMYPHYVPYIQSDSMVPYMDDSGEIKPKKVIKRAEGKAHDLITVEEALEKYTYAHKKAIRQNDLYKEIVKTSKEKVYVGGDERTEPTQLNKSLIKDVEGNGYLTAYIDGDTQQAKISDALYQELAKTKELRIKDLESKYAPILKPLQKVSEIRRNILTTWNPSFLLTNSIKDIQDGLLNSKYTMDMAKNYPGAFYELATQSTDTARQFSALYGSGMVMGEYQIDKLTNSTKNLDIKQMNKIMQAIPNLNEIIELTPRYAEFKASLEHGTSVTEAMYNARELTTNFGRGGYITKALNRNGFTFLNASVQGFDKMIRNFTGANGSKGIAVSVTGTLMKVVALGVAPALFNATAFGAGDDDEDEAYKALPNYIKDNYYLFKVKGLGNKTSKYYDGTFLRIPKGRVLSVFGSAARRTLEFTKGDKNAFDGYLKNVDSQVGINNPEENNIFAPIKQAFGSKNGEAWYGGDIVPKRLQNKPVAEQYDESTDEFSKWLGKTLNISPYKINYLVDQYSGGAGDIVLPMITKETTNGATTVPDYLLAPLKDKFIVNSTDDNKYASNFYSSLEKAQTKANGEKAKVEDKLKYKYMSSISSDMSKLYKEKREIQLDDSLTKKQKYKKVQNVQKEINRLAEEGIKDYKVKDLKSNYGKIANKEYYKNNKNEWSVIKDEESADLNSMRMTSNEKNNYFIAKNKISNIKQQDIDSKIKKSKISDVVLKTNLSDEKMAYLYGKYYSKEETLDIIQDAGISIKEFIKFDSQDIESDYYANGKAVPNSKKKKTIAYINSLNLSAIQKAMLIRMEYSSFTSYDRQIIQYVNNQKLNSEDKKAIYEKLGFKIRNGRVYSK